MKHLFIRAAAGAALCGALCACGHNIGTVVHGKFINVGYDPELNKVGIQYVDGVMATGLQKEKSETSLKFEDSVEKDGVKTATILEYGSKNGDQITGYRVDLEEAKQKNRD